MSFFQINIFTGSVDDHVWAVGLDGRLLVHNQKVVSLMQNTSIEKPATTSHSSDSDWEVV
jgi:hypothetical protein